MTFYQTKINISNIHPNQQGTTGEIVITGETDFTSNNTSNLSPFGPTASVYTKVIDSNHFLEPQFF